MSPIGLSGTRRVGQLLVERSAIPQAALEKLRPLRDDRNWIGLFRQESPERGVMPTELMSRTVSMPTDPTPKFFDLVDELLTRHGVKILVHDASPTTYFQDGVIRS